METLYINMKGENQDVSTKETKNSEGDVDHVRPTGVSY